MEPVTAIKLEYEGVIKRIRQAPVSYTDLIKIVENCFPMATNIESLKYKDEEGDMITVCNDEDVKEAYAQIACSKQATIKFLVSSGTVRKSESAVESISSDSTNPATSKREKRKRKKARRKLKQEESQVVEESRKGDSGVNSPGTCDKSLSDDKISSIQNPSLYEEEKSIIVPLESNINKINYSKSKIQSTSLPELAEALAFPELQEFANSVGLEKLMKIANQKDGDFLEDMKLVKLLTDKMQTLSCPPSTVFLDHGLLKTTAEKPGLRP